MSLQASSEQSSRPPMTETPRFPGGTRIRDFPVRRKTNLMWVWLWMATTSSATEQRCPVASRSHGRSAVDRSKVRLELQLLSEHEFQISKLIFSVIMICHVLFALLIYC